MEEAVNTLSGIDELRSVSSEGISQVFVTFVLEKNVDVASQEVRDKVANIIPDLPKDIDQPIVAKTDPDAAPVLLVALNAKRPLARDHRAGRQEGAPGHLPRTSRVWGR